MLSCCLWDCANTVKSTTSEKRLRRRGPFYPSVCVEMGDVGHLECGLAPDEDANLNIRKFLLPRVSPSKGRRVNKLCMSQKKL